MEIKIGNVVTLKSGSVRMTVNSEVSAKKKVECLWFDDNKNLCSGYFHLDGLKVVE